MSNTAEVLKVHEFPACIAAWINDAEWGFLRLANEQNQLDKVK